MQLEDLALADDRVAGVVAALKADHHVGPLCEQVGDLSLSLVTPLGADDHGSGHGRIMESQEARRRSLPCIEATLWPQISVSRDTVSGEPRLVMRK